MGITQMGIIVARSSARQPPSSTLRSLSPSHLATQRQAQDVHPSERKPKQESFWNTWSVQVSWIECTSDLHSFQSNKKLLIMDQIPTITLTQLINPEGASNEDEDHSKY